MTATLWIHHSSTADVLVRFPTALEAYNFGVRYLLAHPYPQAQEHILPWNETLYRSNNMFDVGTTPCLQLSVHPDEFHPEDDAYLGVHEWSPEPILILTPEEALTLESTGTEPPWCHELEVQTPPRENSVQESAFAEGTTRYGSVLPLPGQLDAWSQDDESVDEDWRQTQIERYWYGYDG